MPRSLYPIETETEIIDLIERICTTLVTQEKYCIENIKLRDDPKKVRPNFEFLQHAHPGIRVFYESSQGTIISLYEEIIGTISFYKGENQHIICKLKTRTIKDINLNISEIITLREFLSNIYEITNEQIRRLEKVLFSFEA
jgi:hypothetical protein